MGIMSAEEDSGSFETLIKYLIWAVLFIVVIGGLYFMLKKFGIL
jgi:hypothetical protein